MSTDTLPLPEKPAPPFLSVIMPAFNEERHLPRALAALVAQTYSATRFEVVLIDNGSTDATLRIASDFADRLSLCILQKQEGSIAELRNYGASVARGEILAFLDCDCFVPRDWLEQAVLHGSPDLLWGAHYLVPPDGTWVGKLWATFQAQGDAAGSTSFIPSGSLFLYRSSFERIGGFNAALQTSEDVELSQRARMHGLRVEAFPSLGVDHAGTPTTLKRFYLQNRWHGKHVVRMFLNNLPRLTHLPLILVSAYVLLMFWASIAGAVVSVIQQRAAFFVVPVVLLLLPAALLALLKTLPKGRFRAAPGLFLLYATYLLARAAALVQPPARSHR